MKTETVEWTLVVAANNETVLQNTLLQSPDIDSDCQVLVKRGFPCAGAAYNSGLAEAGAELVVFAHQDVYLPLSWKQELDSVVEILENENPDWGVLGVFGMTSGSQPKATGFCYSTGLQMVLGAPFNKPVRAQSLDELVLILRRSSGLRFDENLPGFHLYGSDICLQANYAGMDCYIIPAFCIHNSNGLKYLPLAYWQAYFYMRKKWWDLLPVFTCCSRISRSIKPAVAQIVSDVRTWAAKKKQVGTRCADVVSLYGDLVRAGKLDRTKRTSTEEYVRDEPSKVLLLGAGFGTQNMGVGALASGALRCLRAGGREPEVALLDYGTEDMVRTTDTDGRELVLPIVAMRFSKKFYLSNNIVVLLSLAALLRIFPWQGLRTFILNRNACLRHITQVDTAVALSGGDSFSDIYGLGRFFYVCLPQLLILLLQKDLVLLPQTLGPFAKPFPRYIARMILTGAERVYSRDHAGIEQLKLLLGKRFDGNKHRFRYDLGFVVDPRRAERMSFAGFDGDARDGSVVVGLNVSGLLWVSQHNKFNFRSDYRETVRAVIPRMLSIDNVKLLLVPHVFGNLPGSESDLVTCAEVYREMAPQYPGRIGMLESTLDQSEVKAVIGGCDFFIGSRMHACIAALSQHVPAVAIAYSSKFIGVLDTIGVPSLVADARKLDTDEILRVISDAFGSRDMLHEHLTRRIPVIQTAILEICDEIPAFQVHRGSMPEPVLSAQ